MIKNILNFLRNLFLKRNIEIKEKYYENGQIECRYEVKNGERHGLYEGWYDNGQIMTRGYEKNGKLHGLHTSWDANGVISITQPFKNGKMHGVGRTFHENGNLWMVHECKDDELLAEECWHSNGSTRWWRKTYEGGILIKVE